MRYGGLLYLKVMEVALNITTNYFATITVPTYILGKLGNQLTTIYNS